MIKYTSIEKLWQSLIHVFKRFPLPIVFAIFATILAFSATGKNVVHSLLQSYLKGIYLGNFGLALSLAWSLYCENHSVIPIKKYSLLLLIFLILSTIHFFLLPFEQQSDAIILIIIGFALHLLVSFSAFSSREHNRGFWQINKNFFLRFATSVLYSAVLFIGLSVAILSTDQLFNLKLNELIYFRLWIFIVGIFNTIFFLSGIEQPLEDLNHQSNYPKGLKVFTQYLLIPLTSIYVAILLAYEIKIIIQWSLPNSSVAILILGYAVFGILSILLVHPIRNEDGNKWINLFGKSFYLLMLPLLALLGFSIFKRISDYGFTESRYLLIVLALWLCFITLYFLIKGREQIRIIPISLFITCIAIVFGPWGIEAVSKESQQNQLTDLLKPSKIKNDMRAYEVINYLLDHHGVESLQRFVKTDLSQLEMKLKAKSMTSKMKPYEVKYELRDSIINILDVELDHHVEAAQIQKNFVSIQEAIDIENAIKLMPIESGVVQLQAEIKIGKKNFLVNQKNSKEISISYLNDMVIFNPFHLLEILNNNASSGINENGVVAVHHKKMSITKELGDYEFTLYFRNLNGNKEYLNYNGYIIIRSKSN